MKIIVVGHTGMLGREVVKAVERMGHENEGEGWKVDITKMREFERKPEVVINCAGLVPQIKPTPSPSELMLVNGYGIGKDGKLYRVWRSWRGLEKNR